MRRPGRKLSIILVIAGCLMALGASHSGAGAAEPEDPFAPSTDCTRYTLYPDGSRRQTFDGFKSLGGIAALPPRIVTELEPGEHTTYCIGFQNRAADLIDLKIDVVDLAADSDGSPSSQRDAEDRGASKWIRLPTERLIGLKSGDIAWLEIDVAVPADALAGSSYASVLATDDTRRVERKTGVEAVPSVATQLFFDIPGDASRSGAVTNIRSPRVIWWDGLDLGSLPVLGNLRGLGVATVHFDWKNTGDFTNTVGGEVIIESDLSGKQVARLDVQRKAVLRDSSRKYSVTWSRDIPLVGRFTPVLHARGDSGTVEQHELDPIWVIPAWWYIVATILAIALPLWGRRRSRRRYEELLARVEVAEARGGVDSDEHSWDGSGDWQEHR